MGGGGCHFLDEKKPLRGRPPGAPNFYGPKVGMSRTTSIFMAHKLASREQRRCVMAKKHARHGNMIMSSYIIYNILYIAYVLGNNRLNIT